jgi:hypothetical protein
MNASQAAVLVFIVCMLDLGVVWLFTKPEDEDDIDN